MSATKKMWLKRFTFKNPFSASLGDIVCAAIIILGVLGCGGMMYDIVKREMRVDVQGLANYAKGNACVDAEITEALKEKRILRHKHLKDFKFECEKKTSLSDYEAYKNAK